MVLYFLFFVMQGSTIAVVSAEDLVKILAIRLCLYGHAEKNAGNKNDLYLVRYQKSTGHSALLSYFFQKYRYYFSSYSR